MSLLPEVLSETHGHKEVHCKQSCYIHEPHRERLVSISQKIDKPNIAVEYRKHE